MSKLVVNRIKSYLDKTFHGKIDLSDLAKQKEDDQQKSFYSRALSSYSLTIVAGATIDDAASAITDGFDDNGIDAIFFDRQTKNLWLVQSKFINDGSGGIANGDIEKFAKGVKLLIDGDFPRFNKKVNDLEDDIIEALDDSSVKIQILLAYTGKQLSSHNLASINDLLKDQNGLDELIFFTDFNIEKAYKGLETGVGSQPINEDIFISNWGYIEEPFKSYYGQITGAELGSIWEKYGRRLFTENIRSFLGNTSSVNEEIMKTVKTEPENFIYFNNGITILCDSIKKKPMGGADRSIGAFTCNGISVVNGAQTLGSIGSLVCTHQNELEKVKVSVRFISLESSPEGFGQRITIANNTQNKVEKKDFVSLDTEQARIKIELKLDNIDYHYKRTGDKPAPDDNNYLLEEVAFSLASLWHNVDYSTMVKKESNKIWEDVTKPPYTDLFNQNISAQKITKSLKIYRYISSKMDDLSKNADGRKKSIYRYGNSLVAHIVMQKMPKEIWSDSYTTFDFFYDGILPSLTMKTINNLYATIELNYSDSMIPYTLRNYTKSRNIKTIMMGMN